MEAIAFGGTLDATGGPRRCSTEAPPGRRIAQCRRCCNHARATVWASAASQAVADQHVERARREAVLGAVGGRDAPGIAS